MREEALDDTATKLRATIGTEEYDEHFATNRPEDLEVAEDGSVFIALTNNTTVLRLTRLGAAPAREGQRPRGA